MPDLQWNHTVWNDSHPWELDGDEWSVAWGGSRAQWNGSIYPRISRFLPAARILEIAPGRGRWTQYLLPRCEEYFGVDISGNCITHCQQRFAGASRAHFIKNDGRSLQMIPDGTIDFVFSFDSLVHVELDVLGEYMWQLCAKLTPTGAAFLHHSNAGSADADLAHVRRIARAESVSSEIVRQLIADAGCKPLVQEEVNWGGPSRTDCFTAFCAPGAYSEHVFCRLQNSSFMDEVNLVQRFQSPYDFR